MNRRKLLFIGTVGAIAVASIGFSAKAGEELLPPSSKKQEDLIRVEWKTEPSIWRFNTWVYGYLYIKGERFGLAGTYDNGDLEHMDRTLTMICESMKRLVYAKLKTHEYDPVIDNSTTQFYLE